jgi:heat shock protein HspQ
MAATDPTQLPHLLALLDDDSRLVRDSVLAKLAEFGPDLEEKLAHLPDPPSEEKLGRLLTWVDQYQERVRDFYREQPEGTVIGGALFQPGDLVRHRRYGYRGLVVDRDPNCKARETWYENNRTQPKRDQPWYHVLVHDSDAVTYAAQTSLLPDVSEEELRHALVPQFFTGFEGGRYIRNDTRWPRE